MSDEVIRQRIKYIIEHGEAFPQEPPVSRRWVCGIGALIVGLQVVEIILQLT